MNRETYDALVASVEHWRANLRARSPEQAKVKTADYPLCGLFFHEAFCTGCPVRDASLQECCENTPYWGAYEAWLKWGKGHGSRRAWIKAAQREADFLAALVPAGGPDE